jgi:formylglycine-generating enzyme required for sulfatase activity
MESERYLPVEMRVDIQGLGKSQTIAFDLQPAWASVLISSQPVGAQVSVDNEVVGSTPLRTEILQGAHQIELRLDGYKPALLQQDVRAGETLLLKDVVLQPEDGELVLRSLPAGATVIIDDRYHGTTPVSLKLASGVEHDVRLSRSGYVEVREKLTLAAGEQRQIERKLAPQYGTLFLSTVPADAKVVLDGKLIDSGPRLRLPARAHQLEVSKPGYLTQTLSVTPEVGVSKTLQVSLTRAGKPLSGKTTSPTALGPSRTTAIGQELRLVQPTEIFHMGASRREAGRRANESRRKVQLSRPFYLSATEVTNASFRRFRSRHDSGRMDGADLNGDNQPVVNVSWEDAARFCNWLSNKDGLPPAYEETSGKMRLVRPVTTGYRLPTEAEWAYVARRLNRKIESRYPWNGSFPPQSVTGNYADERIADTLAEIVPGYNDGYRGTAPAGSFSEWPAGFHDLGGNVAEWVNDYYSVYPGEAERLVRDPLGPVSGEHRVVRGAGWRHGNITELRLSYRDYSKKPRYDLGFRIARYAY